MFKRMTNADYCHCFGSPEATLVQHVLLTSDRHTCHVVSYGPRTITTSLPEKSQPKNQNQNQNRRTHSF